MYAFIQYDWMYANGSVLLRCNPFCEICNFKIQEFFFGWIHERTKWNGSSVFHLTVLRTTKSKCYKFRFFRVCICALSLFTYLISGFADETNKWQILLITWNNMIFFLLESWNSFWISRKCMQYDGIFPLILFSRSISLFVINSIGFCEPTIASPHCIILDLRYH